MIRGREMAFSLTAVQAEIFYELNCAGGLRAERMRSMTRERDQMLPFVSRRVVFAATVARSFD